MKTFLMIYDRETLELIDEFEGDSSPLETFEQWFLELGTEIPNFKINEILVFYFTGSNNIEQRVSGLIVYSTNDKNMIDLDYPLYHILRGEGFNSIYGKTEHVLWCEKSNSYYLSLNKACEVFDFDVDLDETAIPLEILIPPLDHFWGTNIEIHIYSIQRGRKYLRFEHKPLVFNKFYHICENCDELIPLEIDSMIDGWFFCDYCEHYHSRSN